MKHILTFLFSLLAVTALRAANPPFEAFRGTNEIVIASNVSAGRIIIGPATPISTIASNAAKSLMVWTNEEFYVRPIAGAATNGVKVMTNGFYGIAIGDTNAMNSSFGWPYDGLTYISFLDGTSGHDFNEWVHGAVSAAGNGGYFDTVSSASAPSINFGGILLSGGPIVGSSTLGLYATGGVFSVTATTANGFGFQSSPVLAGNDVVFATNLMRFVWGAQQKLALNTNGTLHAVHEILSGNLTAPTNLASFTFITTNLLSGQTYTNLAQRGHVVATAVLTNVLAGDYSAMSLIVDQNGDGTWDSTNGPVSIQGNALSAAEHQLNGLLQPGARFSFTNQSAGATPGSALIRAGSCQWSRW